MNIAVLVCLTKSHTGMNVSDKYSDIIIDEGNIDSPDVTIISDKATIHGLMKKKISPFKAYATGKIKIKGSLMDLLKLKEFLN